MTPLELPRLYHACELWVLTGCSTLRAAQKRLLAALPFQLLLQL
jgi:hypothetical protein